MSEKAGRARRALPDTELAGPGSPLVDRDVERGVLTAALDRAGTGTGIAVLIEAAAGLGKSRLLAEAVRLARERHVLVLRARATQSEQDFPFGLARHLFEPHLADRAPADRETLLSGAAAMVRPLLTGEVPPDTEHPGRSPFALIHGLYWLVLNIAATTPVLVCVDDLQWGDETSLRFLLYLAERVEDSPIVLLAAARPGRRTGDPGALAMLRGGPAVTTRRLSPLSPAGMTELVHRAAPGMAEEVCAACIETAEGNPFYLHELLLAIEEDRSDGVEGDPDRIRELAGASLARAALFRMVRLGPAAVALAEALAVLGGQAPLQLAAKLAEVALPVAAAAADELAVEQVITSGPVLDFVHPLIRQSIYDEMPPAKRSLDHAAAARLLHAGHAPVEQVAAQLLAAPAGAESWVVETLRETARRATASGASASAARYLERAVEEASDPDTQGALLVELGSAQTGAGITGGADHLRAALDRQRDPARRVEVARLLARALAAEGRPAVAADVLERTLDSADADTESLRSGLLADYLIHASFEPGLRQRAIERATPLLHEPPDATTAEARVLLAVLAMRSGQGWYANGATVTLAKRAWADGALLEEDGADGPGWLMTVWALELAEAHGQALEVGAAALAAARQAGSVDAFAAASYFRGYACLGLGRLADAQADAEQALAAGSAERNRYLVALLVLRVNALLERGELDDAERTLERAVAAVRGGMLEVPWSQHAAGRCALARHRPAEALDFFQQAGAYLVDRLGAEHTVLPWRADAARAALALGDGGRARSLLEADLALADRRQAVIARGRCLRLLGLATDGPGGLELLSESVEVLTGTVAELELAYALADLGAALRRSGRRSAARAPLTAAFGVTRRLGAGLLGGRVRDELAAAGARPAPEITIGAAALTPSERRVADLACQGLTNSEIAQALFVSPKTVEYHLRHVYQRLGITKRRQLRAALPATD